MGFNGYFTIRNVMRELETESSETQMSYSKWLYKRLVTVCKNNKFVYKFVNKRKASALETL